MSIINIFAAIGMLCTALVILAVIAWLAVQVLVKKAQDNQSFENDHRL
jgi:type II secretory pathway component PulJ